MNPDHFFSAVDLTLPGHINEIICTFEAAGFEAFAVGGCVRDALLGRMPKDYDVAANASPTQIKALFGRTADTGIPYGTVTILTAHGPVEATAYRSESGYSDFRHPEQVVFGGHVWEDLSRRDFTVNAMAFHEKKGLCDPFGGLADLRQGIVRAVRDPGERFAEDPLRILRAVRFASQLHFTVEPATMTAALPLCGLIKTLSAERVAAELIKTLQGRRPQELASIIAHGGLSAFGLSQAENLDRLAAISDLFEGYTLAGLCALCGADAAILAQRLRFSRRQSACMVECHAWLNQPLPQTAAGIKRQLANLKICDYFDLLETRQAVLGQNVSLARSLAADILQRQEPFTVAQLHISGGELLAMGFVGVQIGQVQQQLLAHCMQVPEDNQPAKLKEMAWCLKGD